MNCHTKKQTKFLTRSILFLLVLLISFHSFAAKTFKPYILASNNTGNIIKVLTQTKNALKKSGFNIVGEYSPYSNAHVIVVSNQVLKDNAGKTSAGGFGAVQRISLTLVGGKVQVAFTNPQYMANMYRMKSDLTTVSDKLKSALGNMQEFGANEGMSAKQLRKYHYKIFMPYFTDPVKLGKFSSYQKAIESVEKGLKEKRGGTSKVYRVDIDSQTSVIGVGMTTECSSDKLIMGKIDKGELRSTAHLPYEVLIRRGNVIALHGKFRIAQSFPSLGMLGSSGFWGIKCAPDAIKKALTAATGK